jgi:hypothetical protein
MRRCDVCGKQVEVIHVCASAMGAISYGYCTDCLVKGLEPYWSVVAYISCAGKFPEGINAVYQAEVRRILKELNKSEDEFINDVNKSIQDMEDYFSQVEYDYSAHMDIKE